MRLLKNTFHNKTVDFSHIGIILILLIVCGLLVRFYFFPYDVPIFFDAIDYFVYALLILQEEKLPGSILSTNNLWPILLSFFFKFSEYDFMTLVYIQRFFSLSLSVITIVPLYYLCKNFFDHRSAILASTLFLFNPHVIQNSLLGVSDPLYILLITTSLALLFNKNNKIIFVSFFTVGLASLTRYEGLLTVIPFSICYLLRFKNTNRLLIKYLFAILIFALTLLPLVYLRLEATGQDGLTSHILGGTTFLSRNVIQNIPDSDFPIPEQFTQNSFYYFLTSAFINFVKYLIWILIPTHVFFLPVAIFLFIKKKNRQIWLLFFISCVMLIAALYAYGRNIQEVRYLFVSIPFFCVISCYTINLINKKITNQNTIFCILLFAIIASTFIFLEIRKTDYKHESEIFQITKQIVHETDGINEFLDYRYVKIAELADGWPNLPPLNNAKEIDYKIKRIPADGYITLEDYLKESKTKGLEHLLVKEDNKEAFLDDVFLHENKYPYLSKVFDSKESGFKISVKIFKIDYKKFEQRFNNIRN